MIPHIDYQKIYFAIEHYKRLGYVYCEVPWLVKPGINEITSPAKAKMFETFLGNLVGSGEQSFLELCLNGKLGPGKYVCCTPCFRDDDYDDFHFPYFIKVELISVFSNDPEGDKLKIISDAKSFFDKYARTEVVETDIGKDIIINGIEVGSYGWRNYKNSFVWVYGTGVAEPRLSQAIGK